MLCAEYAGREHDFRSTLSCNIKTFSFSSDVKILRYNRQGSKAVVDILLVDPFLQSCVRFTYSWKQLSIYFRTQWPEWPCSRRKWIWTWAGMSSGEIICAVETSREVGRPEIWIRQTFSGPTMSFDLNYHALSEYLLWRYVLAFDLILELEVQAATLI